MLGRERIDELDRSLAEHPERREAQRVLAGELTAMVHGPEEAARAETAAAVLFTDKIADLDRPTLASALGDAPSTPVAGAVLSEGMPIVDALRLSGLATSNKNARQLLQQNRVSVNGHRVGEDHRLTAGDALHGRWIVLRRGKANQHVLVVDG
jgi:tyrosyl-tRNA synthetase